MTRRRELDSHRRSLEEIRNIMNSMKTLAYLEAQKLDRSLEAQHAVVSGIESVAADFLGFHPETLPESVGAAAIYLLIGSERGFCGDFNEAILRHLEAVPDANSSESPALVPIGRKLHGPLEHDPRVVTRMDGASVAEEVEAVLTRAVEALAPLHLQRGAANLYVLYHDGSKSGIVTRQLLPPFRSVLGKELRYSHAPVLNVAPRAFFLELAEHYLFAALHETLYTSLAAETKRRMQHLEGAVRHLDEQSEGLLRRSHALRQEEIIEEIEVILQSAASLDKTPSG